MSKFGIIDKFKNLILPTSGPIHLSHLKYIKWSFLSNILVSTETALGSDNMLHAINYDSENVRTLNYIGKDIIGQIGGTLYMAKISEQADKQPRNFLIYSNVIQQSSYMLMATTSLFDPYYFIPIAGVANIFSNISFTGYGAINAKCIQEMSDNNMGEMYTKITMINTTASSIGLMIGVGICTAIPDDNIRLGMMPIVGMLRVYSYNKAIKGLI